MSIITYDESLLYLHSSFGTGTRVGLDGVRAVLGKLGDPQKAYPVIHVAGTNGKGSNCAFLQHILTAAGYKVGVFTSPHLERYNERIAVGTEPISDRDFAETLGRVVSASDEVISGGERLFFFQILTCMAYSYFAEESVDFAIVETGIGGRLDSTNVIDTAALSVITAPGYDHQAILGESLKEIAAEDAGIIKHGCPAAVYPTPVLSVFTDISEEKNAPLYYIGEDLQLTMHKCDVNGSVFSVKTAYFSYETLSIRLLGNHQVQNAIHALLCAEVLRKKYTISNEAVRKGLAECRWAGRFELVSSEPDIVLDGAHNEDGARIFGETLRLYFAGRKIVLVVGISNSKDFRAILEHMLPAADVVVCTCSPFRALPADELAGCVREMTDAEVLVEEDCHAALEKAVKMGGVTAVAGSLYLVGELRSVNYDRFQRGNE